MSLNIIEESLNDIRYNKENVAVSGPGITPLEYKFKKDKNFYKPGSYDEITSCYERLDYYIEENTYECISSIPEGYFLSKDFSFFDKRNKVCFAGLYFSIV